MSVNLSPVNTFTAFKGNNSHVCTCPECGHNIQEDKPNSKGMFTSAKDKFINIRKFFIDCKHLIGGTCKGTVQGAIFGGLTAGAAVVFNAVKHSDKLFGWKGKALAGAVALGTLAVDIFKAKLDANEEKAALDHRWETGHNE